jgi:hypothetical protein
MKLVNMAIALTIGVVLIGALLVPTINDAEHAGATSYSNGDVYVDTVGSSTAELIITNQNSITSNGDIIDGHSYSAVMCDGITVYITNGGCNIFWTDSGNNNWSAIKGANITINGENKTVTLSNITPATSNDNLDGATELEIGYTSDCYYRATTGDYVSLNNSQLSQAKVISEDQIISSFYKNAKYAYCIGTAATESGAESETPAVITLTDSTPEEFKSISALTWNGATPIAFIVPDTIWTESVIDNSMIGIIYVIPMLFIVGLLIFAARFIMTRD